MQSIEQIFELFLISRKIGSDVNLKFCCQNNSKFCLNTLDYQIKKF